MAAKENNFLKLKQQLKNNEIENLYLFFGEELFVKEMYIEKMKTLIPDDGFTDFNIVYADANSIESAEDALDSFPMMAEKKLIIVKDSGIFKSASQEIKDFWQKRLSDIPDYALLIFDEREVDKRSVTYKALAKYGMPVEFSYMKPFEVSAWAAREAQKAGKKLSKDGADYLVAMCDQGVSNVKNELDKLINYCGDEIYKSDIDKVVSKPMGIVVFEITDALIAKNSDKAMEIVLRMRENRESAFNILYLLSSAFDKMLYCKLMLAEGASYDMVSARLKLAPFVVRKYMDGAKRFSEEFLTERVMKTAECDLAVKQGEADEWTILLQYILECVKK